MQGTRLITVVVMAAVAAGALADEIRIKGVPYAGVRVLGIEDGQAVFSLSGRRITKPLDEVTSVLIDGNESLGQAEGAMSDKKYDQAAVAYGRAVGAARGSVKQLLQVRQLQAFEQAGQTDKAVELWLALVDELGTHQSVMSLRPTKLAAKGSDANTRAISLLETRKAKLDGKGTLGAAVDSALLELYEVQGRSERAQELAGQIVASQPTGDSGSARRAPAAGSPAAVMTACRSLINGGRAQQALASIEELLPKLGSSDLPEAMYLRGQACEKLAASAQGAEARSQLLSAGLSYMRVFAHFPASREAGEALVGAGRVNAALGNKAAARNAWRAVLNRFPDTPAAEQARKAMDSLDK